MNMMTLPSAEQETDSAKEQPPSDPPENCLEAITKEKATRILKRLGGATIRVGNSLAFSSNWRTSQDEKALKNVMETLHSLVPSYAKERLLSGQWRRANMPYCDTVPAVVLFFDLVDFTKLASLMSIHNSFGGDGILSNTAADKSEGVLSALNLHFEPLIKIIHESGGEVAKFCGDALIVYFTPLGKSSSAPLSAKGGQLEAVNAKNSPSTSTKKASPSLTKLQDMAHRVRMNNRIKQSGLISIASRCALRCVQAATTTYGHNLAVELSEEALSMLPLKLKVGISAGPVHMMLMGGDGRCEFVISGAAMKEAGCMAELSRGNEVVVSKAAEKLGDLEPFEVEQIVSEKDAVRLIRFKPVSGGNQRLKRAAKRVIQKVKAVHVFRSLRTNRSRAASYKNITHALLLKSAGSESAVVSRKRSVPEMIESARGLRQRDVATVLCEFVPRPALVPVLQNGRGNLVGELAYVSVVFFNFIDFSPSPKNTQKFQEAFDIARKIISYEKGAVRQLCCDDKGTVLIALYGAFDKTRNVGSATSSQEISGEGDNKSEYAERALFSALEVCRLVKKMADVDICAGVSSGRAIQGLVGSVLRCEYAVVGSTVNISARLMGKAVKSGEAVLCDRATSQLVELYYSDLFTVRDVRVGFEEVHKLSLKGISAMVEVLKPIVVQDLFQLRRRNSCCISEPNPDESGKERKGQRSIKRITSTFVETNLAHVDLAVLKFLSVAANISKTIPFCVFYDAYPFAEHKPRLRTVVRFLEEKNSIFINPQTMVEFESIDFIDHKREEYAALYESLTAHYRRKIHSRIARSFLRWSSASEIRLIESALAALGEEKEGVEESRWESFTRNGDKNEDMPDPPHLEDTARTIACHLDAAGKVYVPLAAKFMQLAAKAARSRGETSRACVLYGETRGMLREARLSCSAPATENKYSVACARVETELGLTLYFGGYPKEAVEALFDALENYGAPVRYDSKEGQSTPARSLHKSVMLRLTKRQAGRSSIVEHGTEHPRITNRRFESCSGKKNDARGRRRRSILPSLFHKSKVCTDNIIDFNVPDASTYCDLCQVYSILIGLGY